MALLFTASVAATVRLGASMASMGELPMPGGWSLSGIWMPMCGQTWLAAATSFIRMWSVMMVAMMLPACVPMLSRYRATLDGAGEARRARLAALAGAGYFCVWLVAGVFVFAPGAVLAALAMRTSALARAAPFAAGGVVVMASALQFGTWKSHRLACCRAAEHCASPGASPGTSPGTEAGAGAVEAWRHGVSLGVRCASCCGNLMLILLAVGVMNLWAMAIMTLAIAAERVAPRRWSVARMIGIAGLGTGIAMMVRALVA